ncbi:MAG TPA: MFS transporter [Candidatus Baltobacteraceae bacterium]|nr:MFS transporter [Candidatus Baltobacteraceae bacterium]
MTLSIPIATERKHAFGFTFVAPLALGSCLNPINSTMIATALVPISRSLHVSAAEAGWLIAALYLASSIAQPAMGRLADLFGPRRVLLLALSVVALSGVVAWLSTSLSVLVAARVLLGIGTSGAYPAAMRIFRVRADRLGVPPPRAAMSFLSLAAIGTMAIGPLLGGVLTGVFGWHSIFTVNVPLALLTAILVILWTPKDEPATTNLPAILKELDAPGLVLFSATLFGLMSFLMRLTHPMWWVLAITIALGIGLVAYSQRRTAPFFDVHMLARNTPLVVTYVRACTLATIIYSVLYGFSQWLESGPGFSSWAAGAIMLPMSVAAGVASFAGGRTKGIRAPFIVSIGLMVLGCLALAAVSFGAPAWLIAAAAVLFGFPQGMFSVSTQAAVYIQAPASEIGAAAGLQRTAFYLGAIIAASVLALVYGQSASNGGFLTLTTIMAGLSALLFICTIFDRTLPRGRV